MVLLRIPKVYFNLFRSFINQLWSKIKMLLYSYSLQLNQLFLYSKSTKHSKTMTKTKESHFIYVKSKTTGLTISSAISV
jgi:hypothetical protein